MTRYLTPTARILLGLIFTVTGLNGFLNFLPRPAAPMPAGAVAFAGAMLKTGYLMPLLMATQLISGLLLLAGRWVPLGLTLLAPVVINIVAFHLFLAPAGLPLAGLVLVLEAYLAWAYRGAFRPMLAWRITPGG
jgi:hypothetical protein